MDVSAVAPVNPEPKQAGLEATRRMFSQGTATNTMADGLGESISLGASAVAFLNPGRKHTGFKSS
jgi:hypothetical protein